MPYVFHASNRALYVPVLYEVWAIAEIRDFECETVVHHVESASAAHDNWLAVMVCFAGLLLCDAWRHADILVGHGIDVWERAGALDGIAVLARHEWWRLVTALTLHADAAHLLGNCLFGLLFLLPLCRMAGFGHGVFYCVFGGMLGNLFTVLFRSDAVRSMGFSTAVFAAVGSLAVYAAMRSLHDGSKTTGSGIRKQWRYPLMAGVGFLAFLGAGGEAAGRVDVTAHAFGFCAGVLLPIVLHTWYSLMTRTIQHHSGGEVKATIRETASLTLSWRIRDVVLCCLSLGSCIIAWVFAFHSLSGVFSSST